MKEADAIVFGSPVYIDNITGQMKVFFDRLADAIHYQQFAGKVGCSVVTTSESGGNDAGRVPQPRSQLPWRSFRWGASALPRGKKRNPWTRRNLLPGRSGKNLSERSGTGTPIRRRMRSLRTTVHTSGYLWKRTRISAPNEYDRWVRMGWIR